MDHSSSRPSISAIILTLNEESTIAAAVKSLAWCDEIFVVDSNSFDSTKEIAQRLGAKVFTHRQAGPFLITDQRNWAIDNLPINSQWVIFLDADEESTLPFQTAVVEALSNPGSRTAFYAAPAFLYYGKWLRHISGYPNWHPRVVKLGTTTKFTGGVWEDFDQPQLAGQILEPYIHRANAKGLSDWIEKHLRYASWEGKSIQKNRLFRPDSSRRSLSRRIRYSLGPLRKYIAIFYLAIIRRGFLDGSQGRSYLRRMFIYELLIDESLKEQEVTQLKGEL